MKSGRIKFICVLVCAVVIFSVVTAVRVAPSGTVPSIICYYNDRAWSLSGSYPVEVNTTGVYYVPLTLFVQLPDVNVRINETLQTFIITHGDLYLSFDTASNFAANQDKIRTPISTYERHGERYVPVEIVCAYLGLGFEKIASPSSESVAIRITDGNEEYSFSTILKRRYPSFFSDATTPPVTSDGGGAVTAPPTLSERTVYITIEDSPGLYTEKILDVLRDYGCKSTFFVVGNRAKSNIEILSRIAAEGHTIALHTMDHDVSRLTDGDAILSDIMEENELLSKVIKQKSRIWRAPDGSDKLAALTPEVRSKLESHGYIIWDANVEIPANYGPYSASNAVINGIRRNEVAVIRFKEDANTADTLKRVLDFIKNNKEACEVRVISSAFNEYFGQNSVTDN